MATTSSSNSDAAYRNNCTKCVVLQKENNTLKAKLDATTLKGKLTKVPYKLMWRGSDRDDRTAAKVVFNIINTLCLFTGVFDMDFARDRGYLAWPVIPALLLLNLVKIVRTDEED
jgi:hypothetical protein